MSVRAKTKKRLIILLAIVAFIVGAGVSFYGIQKHRQENKIKGYRQTGMAAYQAAEYEQAMYDLGKYLRKHEKDAEALFCYAMTVKQIPQDGGWHLVNTMNLLVRVLSIDPNYPQASHELLALYDSLGKNAEALDLAGKMLAANPDDGQAISAKANALHNLRRYDQARPLLERIVAENELDIISQLRLFEILANQGATADELVARADGIYQRHQDDAGAQLLMAFAYRLSGERDRSVQLLTRASENLPGDAKYVDLLVRLLDQAGRYSQSLAVLEAAVDDGGDFRGELVRRLWETGDKQQVLERTQMSWPPVLEEDIELYGVRGMALVQLERAAEVEALVKQLESLTQRRRARAWAIVLGQVLSGEMTPEQRIVYCIQATDLFGNHPYFNYFSGKTYADMGEHELALKAFQYSVDGRPAWRLPRSMRVQSLMALGRSDQALTEARDMVARYPQSINAQLDWLTVREKMLNWKDHGQVDEMLAITGSVQSQLPHEPRSLALYVHLLAETGQKQQASQVIDQAVASEQTLTDEQLLRLASISRQYGLGREQLCYDRLEQDAGQSPGLIYAMARGLALDGDVEAGTVLLEQSMAAHRSENESGWRIVWAKWLQAVDDPRAAEQMRQLGEDYPQSMAVQRLVIHSKAAEDRTFADDTIKRMRAISGDPGLSWRIARAQWLMASNDDAGLSQAVAMLETITRESPGLFEPQMMMAACFEQMGNLTSALEAYTRAGELRPDMASVHIALARINRQLRNYDEVTDRLSMIRKLENLSADEMRQVAELYAALGQYPDAITMLERAYPGKAAPTDEILGNLYRLTGAYDKADAVCASLLARPTLNGLYFVADYYASRGETDKADAALKQLQQLDLQPGVAELLAADHAARYTGRREATAFYHQAVEAAPGNPEAWAGYMINLLAQGEIESMLQVLAQAAAALPDDPALQYAIARQELIRRAGSRNELRPLVVAMLREPDYREVAAEVMQRVMEESEPGSINQQLLRLRQLADSYQEFAALQNLTVQYLLANGQADAAMEVAARAMDTFPASATAAGLAVDAARAAGRWDQVLVAARRLRAIAPHQRMQADVSLAEAMIMTSKPSQAEKLLLGYVEQAQANPEQAPRVLALYGRVLVELNRFDDAEQLFKPLLPRDAQWRGQWMMMAARHVDDLATAGRWLNETGGYLAADSEMEHIEYAQRYSELYRRSRDEQYKRKATAVMDRFVMTEHAGAPAWSFQGLLAESFGDYAAAEKGYRKALTLDPTLHVIRNNLAMVLIYLDGDMDEALQLINQALEQLPDNADYLDTLGQVRATRGEYAQAVQAIEKALMVRPGDGDLTARLAEYRSAVNGQ